MHGQQYILQQVYTWTCNSVIQPSSCRFGHPVWWRCVCGVYVWCVCVVCMCVVCMCGVCVVFVCVVWDKCECHYVCVCGRKRLSTHLSIRTPMHYSYTCVLSHFTFTYFAQPSYSAAPLITFLSMLWTRLFQLATVHTNDDFIVLPHWAQTSPCQMLLYPIASMFQKQSLRTQLCLSIIKVTHLSNYYAYQTCSSDKPCNFKWKDNVIILSFPFLTPIVLKWKLDRSNPMSIVSRDLLTTSYKGQNNTVQHI